MRVINYWEQFLSTGKINDYLAYREEATQGPSVERTEKNEGAGKGAGTGWCYRDNFKNGTDR